MTDSTPAAPPNAASPTAPLITASGTRDAAATAERNARVVSRRWPVISGLGLVLLVAAVGAIIAYREGNLPFIFDSRWMSEMVERRTPVGETLAVIMDTVGGHLVGIFLIPILIIVLFCAFRRFWAALYFTVATVLSAGVVQILKNIYERPRPTDILVTADVGSFPSGHTANAATMAVVLGFILQRAWVWIAGVVYTILMLLSRTYLGAHWLSDTLGGLVLGAGVAVIVLAPFASRVQHERRRRHGTVFSRAY